MSLAFHSFPQMIDDYTTNSHYLTYTFLFKKSGRMYFFEFGSDGKDWSSDSLVVFLSLFTQDSQWIDSWSKECCVWRKVIGLAFLWISFHTVQHSSSSLWAIPLVPVRRASLSPWGGVGRGYSTGIWVEGFGWINETLTPSRHKLRCKFTTLSKRKCCNFLPYSRLHQEFLYS